MGTYCNFIPKKGDKVARLCQKDKNVDKKGEK